MDQINKIEISIPQLIKNTNRISFPFHLNDLNFNAKSGSSATNINDIITMIGMIIIGCIAHKINSFDSFVSIEFGDINKGKVMKNNVFAGVGSPMNDSD